MINASGKEEATQPGGTNMAPAGAGVSGAPLQEEQCMDTTDVSEGGDFDDAIRKATEFFRIATAEQIEALHRKTWERIHAQEGDSPELENWFPQK